MTRSDEPVRLHELRQLVFGELADEAARALERRIAGDPRAQARRAALEAELRSFERDAPIDAVARAVVDRADAPSPASSFGPRPRRRATAIFASDRRWPAMAAVAMAAIALVVLPASWPPAPPSRSVRTKGGVGSTAANSDRPSCAAAACPTLQMYVKDDAGIRKGTDGMSLAAGDWVQFRYRAAGHRYLFVVSVDDDGVLTPLYPDQPAASVPIYPTGHHVLEGSVILDHAVGPERFYAFFSPLPLTFAALEGVLSRIDDPEHRSRVEGLGPEVDQTSILIYKEVP